MIKACCDLEKAFLDIMPEAFDFPNTDFHKHKLSTQILE